MNTPHRPKLNEKLFFFFSGAITSAPFPFLVTSLLSYFLMLNLTQYWAFLITVSFVAPVLEEFAKAYPLFYRHGETQKSLMTLGFLVGLGFGIAEFLFYVFFLNAVPLVRLPALLFHATNTSIVAYGIAKNKAFSFYLIAVFFHFLNNFSLLSDSFWIVGAAIATFGSYILAWSLYRKTTEEPIDHWL